MGRHQAIVSVGSNIDPEENIGQARQLISAEQTLLAESTLIQTEPVGFPDQPDFLNGAFLIETGLDYDAFNRYLKGVESRLQRIKGPHRAGPRTIDLDIVVWDAQVVHDDFYRYEHARIPVSEIIDRFGVDVTADK